VPTISSITHQRVTWTAVTDPNRMLRSSIGGYPILPVGTPWPSCRASGCGQRMSLFLQFDVDDRVGLPFETGASLSVFQCIRHDDPLDRVNLLSPARPYDRLPAGYWDHPHYALFLTAPGQQQQLMEREPFVEYSRLDFTAEPDPPPRSVAALNYGNLKIGGLPFWIQRPQRWSCACGARMEFLCSMPGDLEYPKAAGGPRQPNARANSYFLLLGLSTYVFACRARCDARAVFPVTQN